MQKAGMASGLWIRSGRPGHRSASKGRENPTWEGRFPQWESRTREIAQRSPACKRLLSGKPTFPSPRPHYFRFARYSTTSRELHRTQLPGQSVRHRTRSPLATRPRPFAPSWVAPHAGVRIQHLNSEESPLSCFRGTRQRSTILPPDETIQSDRHLALGLRCSEGGIRGTVARRLP